VTVTRITQKSKGGETYGVITASPSELKSRDRAIYADAARIIKKKRIFSFDKAKKVLDEVIMDQCGEGCAWDLKRINGRLLSGSTKTHTGFMEYGGVFYVLKIDEKQKRLYLYGTLEDVAAPPPKSKKSLNVVKPN
jgi:hypothetical protein